MSSLYLPYPAYDWRACDQGRPRRGPLSAVMARMASMPRRARARGASVHPHFPRPKFVMATTLKKSKNSVTSW